jgi:hypothetical protein
MPTRAEGNGAGRGLGEVELHMHGSQSAQVGGAR